MLSLLDSRRQRLIVNQVALHLLLALRNILRHRRRSAMALAAIASGVAALILAGGLIDWNFYQYREIAIRSQFGHIRVHRAGYLESGIADPFAYLLPDNAPERSAISSSPRVRLLAPRLSFSGLVSHGDSTISFIGEGVVPERESAIHRSLGGAAGEHRRRGGSRDRRPARADPREGLAANLGVKVGDQVVLLAAPRRAASTPWRSASAGCSTITKAYDDSALRVTLATAQDAAARHRRSRPGACCSPDTCDTRAAPRRSWRAEFARSAFEFTPWYELADFYNKTRGALSQRRRRS